MKKLRFFSIFLAAALVAGLLSTTALAAPEEPSYEDITVAAKAALLVDGDTGQVLLDQNAHKELYPASITKCMTTLLVLQAVDQGKLKLDQVITASQSAIDLLTSDSSNAGIKVGEQLTVEQLLYCVMVKSANEACYILAETVSGSVDAFVEDMNTEAKRLGCDSTHFVNPCGLQDPEHYTSAWDIYLITKEAMKYSMFMTLAGTKEYTIPATNLSEQRKFHTTNYMLDAWGATGYLYPYAKGIKTGHTSDAGYCLVSYAEKGERSLISVVLGAAAVKNEAGDTDYQSFSETRRMFEWGFGSFRRTTILDHATPIEQVDVTLSRKTNYVVVHPAEDTEVLLPNNLTAGSNAGRRIRGSPHHQRAETGNRYCVRQQRHRIRHHRSAGAERCARFPGTDPAAQGKGIFLQSADENCRCRADSSGSLFADPPPAPPAPPLPRRPELPHPPPHPPLSRQTALSSFSTLLHHTSLPVRKYPTGGLFQQQKTRRNLSSAFFDTDALNRPPRTGSAVRRR